MVAIDSKLGWLLSGPFVSGDDIEKSAVNLTHVMKVAVEVNNDDSLLNEKVGRFWDLDSVGVLSEGEVGVYERFVDEIKFNNNRYEVKLPFKESHPVIEDNYQLSIKRLSQLKKKLNKNPSLLEQYNEAFTKQLEEGIIERVASPAEIGK